MALCFAGLFRKFIVIINGRGQGLLFPVMQPAESRVLNFNDAGKTFLQRDHNTLFKITSVVFHICIFAAPLSAKAHAIVFDLSWGISIPGIHPVITEICTFVAIAAGLLLLARRVFIPHVAGVSSWRDYAAMICVLLPYITGLLARLMLFQYEIIMLLHYISANILLIAIGWTRLGHMVFFATGRVITFNLKKELTR